IGRGEVGKGDGPLRGTADDTEVASWVALDAEALGQRLVEHERVGDGLGGPRLLDEGNELSQQRAQALARDGRDALSVPWQNGHVGLRAHRDARALEELGLV